MPQPPTQRRHLSAVTFELLPGGRWGSRRGCSFGGYDRICPAYVSTKPFPNRITKTSLYISLWKDYEGGRDQGSWVVTWTATTRGLAPIDQGNFKAPLGLFVASKATRAMDVTSIRRRLIGAAAISRESFAAVSG